MFYVLLKIKYKNNIIFFRTIKRDLSNCKTDLLVLLNKYNTILKETKEYFKNRTIDFVDDTVFVSIYCNYNYYEPTKLVITIKY